MKNLPNKIDTPILPEQASDADIKKAWQDLCKLQRGLKERKEYISEKSKILYDKWDRISKKVGYKIDARLELGNHDEKRAEEKSREVMRSLSSEKKRLVGDEALLSEVEGWPSK